MRDTKNLAIAFTIPDALYVGIKGQEELDPVNFPLGFSTPYEDNAAGKKRRDTVDSWCGQIKGRTYVGNMIANLPISGFSFDRVVSRWRTNNKLFRIQDPRGFSLEISSENLGELLLNSTIENGIILTECVWARYSGSNFLLSVESSVYDELVNNMVISKTSKDIAFGDVIQTKNGGKSRYNGRFYVATIGKTITSTGNMYNRTHETKYYLKKDKKPWHTFHPIHGKDSLYEKSLELYRGIPKNVFVGQDMTPFDKDRLHGSYTRYRLFDSVEEMNKFDLTDDEIKEILESGKI